MATEIKVSLPDNVYDRVSRLAQLMNQDVSLVLADTIESALSPLGSSALDLVPVSEISDDEVLEAADMRMEHSQGERLGKLLEFQQNEALSETQQRELAALMQVYHECLVRKAQALAEAVRRGLRDSLPS
jgi:hypothetical protein